MELPPERWDRNSRTTSIDVGADRGDLPATITRILEASGWTVEADEPSGKLVARREVQRAAQLQPVGEPGRRLLGVWSLKDKYPRGIARGGCVMAQYAFVCTVETDGGHLQMSCEETITGYKGPLPDPTVFWIRSELDSIDPTPRLQAELSPEG